MKYSELVADAFRSAILRELSSWLELDDGGSIDGDLERETFAVHLAEELLESIRRKSASMSANISANIPASDGY